MIPVLFVILTLGQVAFGNHLISATHHGEWELYKNLFSKSYSNIVEEQFRMKIFLENVNRVMEHNKLYAQNLTTYDMQINHLSDKLPSELAATMHGLQTDLTASEGGEECVTYISPDNDVGIPASVDWRKKGVVTPVKDQGECGSCWAFSATGALEGQHARATGKLVSLSEQDLVDCCKTSNGCEGGLMTSAFQCIKNDHGIDSETDYPYEAKDGKCRYNSAKAAADDKGCVEIQEGSELDLMKAVATIGPVSVGIIVSDTFYGYKSGVYYNEHCNSEQINHGVLVVGYGTENYMDYWLVKNSWSELFGEQGYIKMARNKGNNCAIATLASYPLV